MKMFRVLLVISIVVAMSLVLVWEQNHITKVGYNISSLQKRKTDLIEKNRVLEHGIGKLLSGDRICQVIDSLNLEFVYDISNINKQRLFTQASVTNGSVIKGF